MANIDSKVASLLDHRANDSDDEDALIRALEEDEDDYALSTIRERRRQQLDEEMKREKSMQNSGTGSYTEIRDEKAVMDITTGTKYCVVHFFHPTFGRCGVMDGHLETLAPKHFDTRFIKIHVDNAPFLVTKLQVQVLPCVIAFIDGVGKDRIIGFEGLGRGDDFTTQDLEYRLLLCGVLTRAKMTDDDASRRPQQTKQHQQEDEYDDDDWD